MVCYALRPVTLRIRQPEHKTHNSGFALTNGKIVYFLLSLVHSPGLYQLIAIRANSPGKMPLLVENMQTVCCTDRGLLTLSVSLPETNVVQQAVCMGLNALFSFFGSPDADFMIDKPFHYKRRLVRDSPNTVKHEYQQNIEHALERVFLDHLYLVPVFRSHFMAGDPFLLQLAHDCPTVLLGKGPAGEPLHRNVGFVVGIMIKLLCGGNTV